MGTLSASFNSAKIGNTGLAADEVARLVRRFSVKPVAVKTVAETNEPRRSAKLPRLDRVPACICVGKEQ